MDEKSKNPGRGIVWNDQTRTWEIYGTELVIRDGRRVPNFTTDSFHAAVIYAVDVEGWR